MNYSLDQCFLCDISEKDAPPEKRPFHLYKEGFKHKICRGCITLWKVLSGDLLWVFDAEGNDCFIPSHQEMLNRQFKVKQYLNQKKYYPKKTNTGVVKHG